MWLRIRRGTSVIAFVVLASIFGFCTSPSLAIGPSNQTISPTYDSVVRVLLDVGLPGGQGFFEGTGSVVGNTNRNGQGYLWILTADHVVSSTGAFGGNLANGIGIAFGNSPTSSGNSVYYQNAKANPADIFRYGSTGHQDLTVFGINDRGNLPHFASERLLGPNRRYFRPDAHAQLREVILAKVREQFHLPTSCKPEQYPAATADNLTGFDIALKDQARFRSNDIEPVCLRAELTKSGLGHPDPSPRGVALSRKAVDIGFRYEAAINQLERSVEIGLSKLCIGLRDIDLSRLAGDLLALHRPVDHGKNFTFFHPITGIDQD